MGKDYKIFISHSSKDKRFVEALVKLFALIGISKKEQLICTSVSGFGVPLNKNIYKYLREQFENYNLHIIFLLSSNYYSSSACMNEMGAAWVIQAKYTSILLPGFQFDMIQGAIDPAAAAIQMDTEDIEIKGCLNELKDELSREFELPSIPQIIWERYRDDFIKEIKTLDCSADNMDKKTDREEVHLKENKELSYTAVVLLACLGKTSDELLYFNMNSNNVLLYTNEFYILEGRISSIEEYKLKKALGELEQYQMIQAIGAERHMFRLTDQGILYAKYANQIIKTTKLPREHLFFNI